MRQNISPADRFFSYSLVVFFMLAENDVSIPNTFSFKNVFSMSRCLLSWADWGLLTNFSILLLCSTRFHPIVAAFDCITICPTTFPRLCRTVALLKLRGCCWTDWLRTWNLACDCKTCFDALQHLGIQSVPVGLWAQVESILSVVRNVQTMWPVLLLLEVWSDHVAWYFGKAVIWIGESEAEKQIAR